MWAIRLTAQLGLQRSPGCTTRTGATRCCASSAGRWELLVDLFAIHLIPTLQVFLGMLPVYVVSPAPAATSAGSTSWRSLVGLGAVALELVADLQMHRFVRTEQPGQVMDRGLWGWSRHPNYFGEIGFWSRLALFGLAASPSDWWWLFVGAVAMLAMFLGREHPDDGEAQPGAAAGLPGRHRPGPDVRAAAPRRAARSPA